MLCFILKKVVSKSIFVQFTKQFCQDGVSAPLHNAVLS